MEKRQIGKLQIALGILILILSITGIIIVNGWIKERDRINHNFQEDLAYTFKDLKNNSVSTEIMVLNAINFTNQIERNNYYYNLKIMEMILFSVIIFILSLMLLTQGLVNISKK